MRKEEERLIYTSVRSFWMPSEQGMENSEWMLERREDVCSSVGCSTAQSGMRGFSSVMFLGSWSEVGNSQAQL